MATTLNDLAKRSISSTEGKESESSSLFFSYSEIPWLNIILNVLTWFFLSVGLVDFLLQSCVILFEFFSSLFQPMKNSRRAFAALIIAFFIYVRLNMLMIILGPILFQVWEGMGQSWVHWMVTYVSSLTTFIVYSTGIIFAFVYFFKYGIKAKKSTRPFPPSGEEPMIAILMPIYNETPPVLFRAIDSMITVDYPAEKKHLFLSFDDAEETELYFQVLAKLGVLTEQKVAAIGELKLNNNNESDTDPLFPTRIDVNINGMTITISRFPHGGKNAAQGHGFRLVQNLYSKIKDSTYILSIDSDIILHKNALHNFVAYAHSNPNFMAATGLLTCSTQYKVNIYQYLQNAEYVESQVFMRAGEAGLGAVTCLPGAMTFVKMESLEGVADTYFYRRQHEDLKTSFQYHREAFGEDRYLTYLLIKSGTSAYQVVFVPNAVSKTDAPDTFTTLMKQRRRWMLGAMACETYQLTSPIIWKRLPLLQIYKMFIYEARSLDWVSWVILLSLLTLDNWSDLAANWILFLFPLMVLFKYLIFAVFCLLTHRKKLAFYYIVLMLFMPAFTLITVFYSAFTWNVRSWGGPRSDGPEADKEDRRLELMTNAIKQTHNTKDVVLYL